MSRFLGEPMSEDTLFAFWKRAVVQGFANQMAQPVAPTRRGFTHAYRFAGDRNLEYREEFAGMTRWSGDELIVHDFEHPRWRLSVHGGFEPWLLDPDVSEKEMRSLKEATPLRLREALSTARTESLEAFLPRGPVEHRMDDLWVYRCDWNGGFDNFVGTETLGRNGMRIMTMDFIGGIIL